jgi:hypothetical protein
VIGWDEEVDGIAHLYERAAMHELLQDEPALAFVFQALQSAGYRPELAGSTITVRGAGVGLDDNSIDLDVAVVVIEDVRIVELSCLLRSVPGTFEAACLAAVRGGGACAVAKFSVEELEGIATSVPARFRIRASLPLFADHLSQEEFTKMTWLFLKETDAIDNELAEILAG